MKEEEKRECAHTGTAIQHFCVAVSDPKLEQKLEGIMIMFSRTT